MKWAARWAPPFPYAGSKLAELVGQAWQFLFHLDNLGTSPPWVGEQKNPGNIDFALTIARVAVC